MIDSAALGKRQGTTMPNSTVDPSERLRFPRAWRQQVDGSKACVGVCPDVAY